MPPNEIRAELIRLGIKIADIARDCGVTGSAVSQAISQVGRYKGRRIRAKIASRMGRPYKEVWGCDDPPNSARAV